jgi:hypothetical protein
MAAEDDGNKDIINGTRISSGKLYRITPDGDAAPLVEIPFNGLSGIERRPKRQRIVVARLREGSLVAVSRKGKIPAMFSCWDNYGGDSERR